MNTSQGYLWSYETQNKGVYIRDFSGKNCGELSASPHVVENYLQIQESFYTEREAKWEYVSKMTGRYKETANKIRQELVDVLSDVDNFSRLQHHGAHFTEWMVVNYFLWLPKIDIRDTDNSLWDSWINNMESLVDSANAILEWAQKNAEGPVSVI